MSPYTPALLVQVLTFKIILQNFKWILSSSFDFEEPHTSQKNKRRIKLTMKKDDFLYFP